MIIIYCLTINIHYICNIKTQTMTKGKDLVWQTLHVVSWIIFIGLSIQTGTLLFNFVYGWFKPFANDNLNLGLNLAAIYRHSPIHYGFFVSFVIILWGLKAYVFYFVLQIFKKLNLVKPFSEEISALIRKISLYAFVIGLASAVAQEFSEKLILPNTDKCSAASYWTDSSAFLLMSAILFVISQIFKKGIELQNENDLTV